MFKFCSLYSGSTGNSLFVETPNTKILIDAGESAKKIVSALSNICVDIENIDAKFDKGLLTITIPKQEVVENKKKIEIKG